MEADVFVKLDAVFTRYIEQPAWQQAVQNRMTAASIAHRHGRTDLFDQYSQQAIDLAATHHLERLELSARIQRFTYWLMQDLSGKRQDELEVELSYKPNRNDAPEPSGLLAEELDKHSKSALDAYTLISKPHQSGLSCKDSLLEDSLTLAKQKTIAFGLNQLSGEFEEVLDLLKNGKTETLTDEVSERIQRAAQQARSETERICNSLRVDMCLLLAERCRKLRDADTAEGLFKTAEQFSEDLPEKRVTLYMTWADHYEGQGQIQKAIDYANKAKEAAGQINVDALKEQAAGKLQTLLVRDQEEVPNLCQGPGATERVMSVLDQAHQFLLAGRFEDSLKSCEIALDQAISPQLRRAVLRERAIALYELGRFTEVETDLNECISLISDELSSDQSVETGAFDQRILEEEDLYLMKAYLMAKIGRSTDSWVIAEQGRSHRLKQEIATSRDFPSAQFEDANFDTIRDWLHSEQAAMLCFGVTRWGTLVLTAGPDDTEPTAEILDQFTGSKLEALLGKKLESQEQTLVSNSIIVESITGLSVGLIHPLSERLVAITQGARVLYIVPDSFLYYAPFAALTLADHRMLIDLCPLAFTSSCTILRWSASRQMETTSQNCLAVAVGKDTEGYEFRNHLTQISTAPWGQDIHRLEDEAATTAEIARLAPNFPVLYFVCHGRLDTNVRDIMAASQLELAEKPRLTARDISQWKLQADLVFLNSCQSGRFRLKARTDVNGLVRAFILAGARSLIAPLIHIEPRPAGELAQAFFQAWLTGANKAEALRKAQFAARQAADQKDKNLMDWATYRLFGYFR